MPTLELRKGRLGWWISGLPPGCTLAGFAGPYRTREEAQQDMQGLNRFFADNPADEYQTHHVPSTPPGHLFDKHEE